MDILIATKNAGKFLEIKSIFEEAGLADCDFTFYSPDQLGISEDFEENGSSFEENALGKARFFAEKSGMLSIADDSGLFVKALADELGVKTRRWGAGEGASDEEWLEYFMNRMEGEKDRTAKFVCAAAFATPDGKGDDFVLHGETEGDIADCPEAPVKAGIPLSSVFRPKGCKHVYAALDDVEKGRISHRGKAFSKLARFLFISPHKRVLADIEKDCEKYWIVGPEVGNLLRSLVAVSSPRVALEIGTSVGYSAIWIALGLGEEAVLWTVESHAKRFEAARENIFRAGLNDKIIQVKGHAPEVLDEIFCELEQRGEFIDFAFFDATKKDHQRYYEAVLPKMAKGGVIVVDNVISHREKMLDFLDKIKAELECVEVPLGKGVLIARV